MIFISLGYYERTEWIKSLCSNDIDKLANGLKYTGIFDCYITICNDELVTRKINKRDNIIDQLLAQTQSQ